MRSLAKRIRPSWVVIVVLLGVLVGSLMADVYTAMPTVANVTLTDADTEYSLALSNRGTGRFTFQARTAADIRFAFETGKVAGPTEPYMTLKSGTVYNSWEHLLDGTTSIYFGTSVGGTVVEIEYIR